MKGDNAENITFGLGWMLRGSLRVPNLTAVDAFPYIATSELLPAANRVMEGLQKLSSKLRPKSIRAQ